MKVKFGLTQKLHLNSGSIVQYGYTGREPDASSLIYYRARYYDPNQIRFTQRDPAGFRDGFNRYSYVHNNPVNLNDPDGLVAQSIGVTITNTQNTSYYAWNSGGSGGQSTNPFSGSAFTGESYQVADASGTIGGSLTSGVCQCTGSARVFQGNSALIGLGGAFNTNPPNLANYAVTTNSAAIIPSQFGLTKPEMRGIINQISGTLSNGTTFGSVRFET